MATLLHYAISGHWYFFYRSEIVFPAWYKFPYKFAFKDLRDIYSNMVSLNNSSHYCPQFYTLVVNLSIDDCYWSGQSDPNNMNTGQQQAPSKTSPGPEGHTPSRSDLNRMREAGDQLSFCKGEAKDKSDLLKTQSRPWIFPLCLGLELQDYGFCDDGMNSDRLNQNNPGPKNHFCNWKQLRVQHVWFFFFWMSYFVVKQNVGPTPAGGSTQMSCCHYILSRQQRCFGKTPVMQVHVMLVNFAKVNL